jgi:hypothetical protein
MRQQLLAVVAAVAALLCAPIGPAHAGENELAALDGEYRITGPFIHENLSIFLIHGRERLPGRTFLTLQEAIENGKAVVTDVGNGSVAVENRSNEDVFVQAGDLLEGTSQDRCFPDDVIVSPGAEQVPVPTFYVEAAPPMDPDAPEVAPQPFRAAAELAPGKNFEIAARLTARQDEVWAAIAANQLKLRQFFGERIEDKGSPSSFPLALKHEKVAAAIDPYVKKLIAVIDGKGDTIGYALVVNGKVNSADVYGSHALFVKMWPKLLRSSAIEAIAEHPNKEGDQQPIPPPPTPEAVKACLQEPAGGAGQGKLVAGQTMNVTHRTKTVAMFETLDPKGGGAGAFIHRSYITIDPPPAIGEENATWRRRTR